MRDPQPNPATRRDPDPDALLVIWLEARAEDICDAVLERTRRLVPGCAVDGHTRSARDLCAAHVRAVLTVAREQRDLTDRELAFVRDHAVRSAERGVPLEALLRAHRQGQRVVVGAVVAAAEGGPADPAAALRLTERILGHADHVTTALSAAYLRARRPSTGSSAAREELLSDTVAGTAGAAGPDRARALGIDWWAPHVVVCVVAAEGHAAVLPELADGLAAPAVPTAVRHDEVLVVAPVVDVSAEEVRHRVAAALTPAARAGMGLPCLGLGAAPAAYAEARTALRLAEPGAVAAVGDLTAGRYLALTADGTAHRLIDPRVRATLEADLADGGVLAATLEAYLDADMHAPAAAALLHVHPNTVYYRLDKLTGTTGTRSRRVHDLHELLTALRIIRARRP